MKYFWITALSLILFSACNGPEKESIKIIAHRGYWDTEGGARNSIAALQNAQKECFYGAEFDVWVSLDSVAVVFHDPVSDSLRLENENYERIKDITLANGEKLPLLRDYLACGAASEGTKLILELKVHSGEENVRRSIEVTAREVKAAGLGPDRLAFISFSLEDCKALKAIFPEYEVAYLGGELSPGDIKTSGLDGLDYHWKVMQAHPEWVEQAHESGLSVNVWTVNTQEIMQWCIDNKVDYITTDKPIEVRDLIHKNVSK